MKRETIFRKQVDKFLKSLGNTYEMSIQQKSIRGDADKILCCHGRFVWMELKTSEGVPDPLQAWKASQVKHQGRGIALTVSPDNWEAVKNFLTLLSEGLLIYDSNDLCRTGQPKIR